MAPADRLCLGSMGQSGQAPLVGETGEIRRGRPFTGAENVTQAEYAAQLAALDVPALLEECRRQHALDLRTHKGRLPAALIACWEECQCQGLMDVYRTARTLAEQDIVTAEREQAERVRALNAAEAPQLPKIENHDLQN